MPAPALIFALGVLGCFAGACANYLIVRLTHQATTDQPCLCGGCQDRLSLRDRLPLLACCSAHGRSQLRTHGKTRWPFTELSVGALFACVAWWWAAARQGVVPRSPHDVLAGVFELSALLVFATASIALAAIDVATLRLPNVLVTASFSLLLALFFVSALMSGAWTSLFSAGAGAALLMLIYGALWCIWPGGMGFGDVKLAAVIGLVLGWLGWAPVFFGTVIAFAAAGVFGAVMLVTRKARRHVRLPFGPFMLLGAWVAVFASTTVIG